MSDPTLKLPIEATVNDAGFRQTEAWLKKLQALQQAVAGGGSPAAGGGAARGVADAGAAASKSERDILRYANALAASQRAAGDAAGAAATYEQALAAITPNTVEALQATTKLTQAQNAMAKSSREAAGGAAVLPRTIAGLSHEALNAVQAITGIGGAMALISKGSELAQLGAQAAQTRVAFDGLATQAHTTGDALLGALRSASKGEISDLNLELAANRAQLLGVADSAQEFSALMEVARSRARAMGTTATDAFNDIVTGIGRTSPRILDNLGIVINEDVAYKTFAASIGKTSAQLSDAEKKQAIFNAVIKEGQATIAATGGAADTVAGSFAQVSAEADNAKAALGGAIAELLRIPAEQVAGGLHRIADGLNQIATAGQQQRQIAGAVVEGATSFEDYGKRIAFVNEQLEPLGGHIGVLTSAQYDFAKSLIDSGKGAADAAAEAEKYAGVVNAAATADTTWGEEHGQLLNQMMGLAQGTDAEQMAVQSLSAQFNAGSISGDAFRASIAALSTEHTTNAQATALDRIESEHLSQTHQTAEQAAAAFAGQLQQLTGMTEESANKSMLDTQAKETQQLQMQVLSAQADQTVASFLRLNPGIDEAGIASLMTAGKIPPLIAQLAALEVQAARARASIAWLNGGGAQQDFRAGERSLGSAAPGSAQQSYQSAQRAREAAIALAQAQHDQALATGSASQKLTQLKADLDKATASYGANSAEAVRAETALRQFQQSQAKGGGRGRGGGAAGKLDKIRTDEYQKTEDAELQHRKRLLDIEKDYDEKSLEQAKKNEVAKRASRADFYDKLTQSTKDIGGDVAQQLSAEYEAAFAKAREMEQKGNYQQAEDFRKAKEKQLNEELDYRKALADVQKNDDLSQADKDAETSRLQAIHQLRQDELNEELKQVEEGGDAINQAKQKAVDDENLRYEEQLGKIADTSDRKAAAVNKGFASQSEAARRWASDMESSAGRVKRALEDVPEGAGGGGASSAGGSEGGSSSSASPSNDGGGVTTNSATRQGGRGIRSGQQSRGGAENGQSGNTPGTGSGGGAQNVTDVGAALIEANEIIKQIIQAGAVDKKTLSQLERYQDTVATATAVLSRIADLRAQLAHVGPPISSDLIQELASEAQKVAYIVAGTITTEALRAKDAILKWSEISEKTIGVIKGVAELRKTLSEVSGPVDSSLVKKLAQEAQDVTSIVLSSLLSTSDDQKKALQRYADTAEAAVKPLSVIADLREKLATPQPALTGDQVKKLAKEAEGVLYLVQQNLIPTSEEEASAIQHYADAATAAIGALSAVADLRKSVVDLEAPLTRAIVEKLAREAEGVLYLVSQNMLPISEETAAAIQRYTDAAGNAIDLLSAMIDLRKALAEPTSPLKAVDIQPLADEAAQVLQLIEASLLPTTEDEAGAVERYAGAAGNAIDVLKGVVDLRSAVRDLAAPLRTEDLERLADEGKRAYQVLSQRLIPVSEDEAKAVQQYADTVGAAIDALKAPLDLSGKLFADYQSPSDAQLDLLAKDAARVADRLLQAAAVYDTKGLEAGKAYAEAVGGTFAAYKDGLLFFSALDSGDFVLDAGKLAQFEDSVALTLKTADRLGALAATIPAGNITALNSATSALDQAAQTMIHLSSVPYGNLSEAIGSLGGGSTGGTSIANTFYNSFTLPNGSTQQMANEIIGIIKQQMQARR